MWKRVWERVGSTGVDRAVGVWVVMWFAYGALWDWVGSGITDWRSLADVVVFWLGCGLVVTRWVRMGVVVGLVGILGLGWWATLTQWLRGQDWMTHASSVIVMVWASVWWFGVVAVLVWQGVVRSERPLGLKRGEVGGGVETRSLNYARGEAWGGFEKWLMVWVLVLCAVMAFNYATFLMPVLTSVSSFSTAILQGDWLVWTAVGWLVGMGIAGGGLLTRRGAGWAVVAMGVGEGVETCAFAWEWISHGWAWREGQTLKFCLRLVEGIAPGVLVGMLWWESRRRGG